MFDFVWYTVPYWKPHFVTCPSACFGIHIWLFSIFLCTWIKNQPREKGRDRSQYLLFIIIIILFIYLFIYFFQQATTARARFFEKRLMNNLD